MKMPNPIAIRFAKLIFSILSITVLGVIFAMISHDHKLLILSAGVAITGGVKTCSFYRQVSRQQYECLEGLLVQEQVNIHRKRHAIVLELENSSTRISPASSQHISLIRDIVFFCTSKVVL